jgi:carboxylesterase type B
VYTAALALLLESEDCLILDIYIHENQTTTSAEKLPVMITIHSRGYNAGPAASNPRNAIVHQSNGTL